MSGEISVEGDQDDGGGVVSVSTISGFKINGVNVIGDGSSVSSHPPCATDPVHCNAITQASINFKINGISVVRNGDIDSCGHVRLASSNFRIS